MATSLPSDFKIVDSIFQMALTETLAQNADAFNAATNGAFSLDVPEAKTGFLERIAFHKAITDGAVSRRDITSISAATSIKLEQGEIVRPKLDRKIGPIDLTLASLTKIGSTVDGVSLTVGDQAAKGISLDMVNTGLGVAAQAMINLGSTAVYDGTAGTMTHAKLVEGLKLFGDRAKDIVCWVMHSKVAFDLLGLSISSGITNIADVAIMQGTTGALGRPILITDSADLILDTTTDQYYTLGLTAGGISAQFTEAANMTSTLVTGLENLVQRFQGEYAWNLGLKGYAWTTGTTSPSQAAVKTGSNWTKAATSLKDTAGVLIKTV